MSEYSPLLPPLTPDASLSCSGVLVAQSTSWTYTLPMPKVFSNGIVEIVVRVAALAVAGFITRRFSRERVVQVVHGGSYVC